MLVALHTFFSKVLRSLAERTVLVVLAFLYWNERIRVFLLNTDKARSMLSTALVILGVLAMLSVIS